jgi:hypothetical protein
MKKSKKNLMEMLAILVSIVVFYLIFHNWDQIKDFIGNLF